MQGGNNGNRIKEGDYNKIDRIYCKSIGTAAVAVISYKVFLMQGIIFAMIDINWHNRFEENK